MPRIKLHPLESYRFSTTLMVRVTDLNRADHLSAYALVGMLDEAYGRFVAGLGLGGAGFGVPNVSSINAELQVNYKGEGKLHDELTIDMGVGEIATKGFRLHYRVTCGDRPIALAEVGVVSFDYVAKEAVAVPAEFIAAVSG